MRTYYITKGTYKESAVTRVALLHLKILIN